MAKKSALGRGLGALIDDSKYEVEKIEEKSAINEVELAKIQTNPFQPRTHFDDDVLSELANSIRNLGIIQPVTLRKLPNNKYQLISGERRCRASKLAGLKKIPAFIRDANDQEMLEFALVENIQRENLNAIEVAISYRRLLEECKLTQENLSERVGKRRSTITNYLRLLKLPAEIQIGIRDKKIGMGHAKALIGIEDNTLQTQIYFKAINEALSVRALENLVREMQSPKVKETPKAKTPKLSDHHTQLKNSLALKFNTNVDLSRNESGKGKIVIPFKSDSELARILELLRLEK